MRDYALIESFDSYPDTGALNGVYSRWFNSNNPGISLSPGVYGGQQLVISGNVTDRGLGRALDRVLGPEFCFEGAIQLNSLPGDLFAVGNGIYDAELNSLIIRMIGPSGTHCAIGVMSNGAVYVARRRDGNFYEVYGISDPEVIQAGKRHNYQVEGFIDTVAGWCKVYIDGSSQPVIDVSGINTQYGSMGIANLYLWQAGGRTQVYDDLLMHEGPRLPLPARIGLLPLTGDVSSTLVPSIGTDSFSLLNSPIDDTTFLTGSVIGEGARFTLGDMAEIPLDIYGVAITPYAFKTDVATRELAIQGFSGAATSSKIITLAEGTHTHFPPLHMGLNPATGLPWLKAEIDALEVGVEVAA